ncbi:MAG: hypothetical protein AAF414_15350 [Pseudomonadota bacterium]
MKQTLLASVFAIAFSISTTALAQNTSSPDRIDLGEVFPFSFAPSTDLAAIGAQLQTRPGYEHDGMHTPIAENGVLGFLQGHAEARRVANFIVRRADLIVSNVPGARGFPVDRIFFNFDRFSAGSDFSGITVDYRYWVGR